MEIKDIVEQQKLEKALERSKKKQDDFTRKEFLKDCYKFWKEYKKVEHPYTWWLGWFSLWNMIDTFYLDWYRLESPKAYKQNSWFENKWKVIDDEMFDVRVYRKADPKERSIYFHY